MKIRSQSIISLVVFGIILIVTVAFVIFTSQQTANLSAQQEQASRIQRGATNLNYLSNYYFLYQEDLQLEQWNTAFNSLSADLSSLKLNNPSQQTLLNVLDGDLQNLNSVFENVVAYLQNAPRNVSVRVDPQFQTQWIRMALQNQALASDASQLSQAITNQVDQLNLMSTAVVFVLFGTFGVYFLAIYLLIYRRALKSISNLQAETKIIGEGNLDHRIKISRQDEVGELSQAFNQMTANLKTVTTCKADLEKLVEERTKKLELSSMYARNLIEASLDPLVTISKEGKITDVNNATEYVTGCSREELVGSDFSDYFTEPEQARAGYRKVFTAGFVKDYPLAIRHKTGRITYVLYNASIYQNPKGEIQGVFAAARDITELRKAEEQEQEIAKKLKDAERLAAIGATAGMVGHDIRNPLQSIVGDLYLAKTDLASSSSLSKEKESIMESLQSIEQSVEYINKIVADLQDFAKPLNPHIEQVNFKNIMTDLLKKNGLPKNIKAKTTIAKEAQILTADSAYIKRILGNLVSNAVQAMPNGGKLTIQTNSTDNTVIITVSDTGVGIPDEAKPKLFQPLFTTKSKGQGFGLAVVKRLTEALNGTVTFESQQGKGTTFTITIPQKT